MNYQRKGSSEVQVSEGERMVKQTPRVMDRGNLGDNVPIQVIL